MKKILILLSVILIGVYWQWFIGGSKVATDYPNVSSAALKSFINLPQLWSEYGAEGLGEYTVFTLWSWPFVFISSILASFGLGFEWREKFLIMIPFLILGVWGMWKLGNELKLSRIASFLATLFYLANTYILTVLDGGQLTIGLGYAFFPVSFLAIKNSFKAGLKKKILASFSLWILGFFDFRLILLMVLLCLIYFFYELLFIEKRINFFLEWFKTAIICGLIVTALNAYWLIPIIKVPLSDETVSKLTQTDFSSLVSLGHAMMLLAPHWFKNVFGVVSPIRFEFIFIPLLVFLAPILRPKDRVLGFWLIVAIISIFLTKGIAEPFGQIYHWLYLQVPAFSLFRDSTKFFFLTTLSYAVLMGMTIDELLKIKFSAKLKIMFVLAIILYLLFLIRPSWQGMMTGTLSVQPLEEEYSRLNQFLDNDKQFSRIFWIPSIPPLASLDANHPSVEALRLVEKRPFAQATLGTYEIFNFLREAPYMGEIFDVAAIGYIAYPYLDLRRDNLHPDNISYYYNFSDQLSKLSWLTKVEQSKVPLFQINNHQDRFFLAPNIWWVIGSDSIYQESTKSAQLKLAKNALVFVEEHPGLGKRINELENFKIILHNKTLLDLAATFISGDNLIFPSRKLDEKPNQDGWWKKESSDLIWWRYFLKTKYGIDNQDFDLGGGWAIGEGNLKLMIENKKLKKGHVLLTRTLESKRGGELIFSQNSGVIGKINTKVEGETNVRWFEIGEILENESITISTRGDINVVNSLAVVPNEEWLAYKNRADDLQRKKLITKFEEVFSATASADIQFKMINPTRYKITVSNLTQPTMLIFSSNFDPSWQLENKQPFPIFSLLNGFLIDQDGDYELIFKPQKYAEIGFFIFLISVVSLMTFLILSKVES